MQKASPPPLLPLLRSRLQAEVLTLVLLNPQLEWSLTELASRTGASILSVQRGITRAEQTGAVSSRRLGNLRLVNAADSPLTTSLTEFLLRSFGPSQMLAEELVPVTLSAQRAPDELSAGNGAFPTRRGFFQRVSGAGRGCGS